jgi:hypothetical protein
MSSSSVVEVATAESAAIPSATPICCEVLKSPEARPASEACTPAGAAIEIGTNEKPPDRDQPEPRQEVAEVGAVDGYLLK